MLKSVAHNEGTRSLWPWLSTIKRGTRYRRVIVSCWAFRADFGRLSPEFNSARTLHSTKLLPMRPAFTPGFWERYSLAAGTPRGKRPKFPHGRNTTGTIQLYNKWIKRAYLPFSDCNTAENRLLSKRPASSVVPRPRRPSPSSTTQRLSWTAPGCCWVSQRPHALPSLPLPARDPESIAKRSRCSWGFLRLADQSGRPLRDVVVFPRWPAE